MAVPGFCGARKAEDSREIHRKNRRLGNGLVFREGDPLFTVSKIAGAPAWIFDPGGSYQSWFVHCRETVNERWRVQWGSAQEGRLTGL